MFGIPVTAFTHATTARAQYKWRNVVKDREILTRVQQPHVSILNLLKGAPLISKRHWIRETAQAKMVSVIQKTHNEQGATEVNDNSNEWVSFLMSH